MSESKNGPVKIYAGHRVGVLNSEGDRLVFIRLEIAEQALLREDPLTPIEVHEFVLPPERAEVLSKELHGAVETIYKKEQSDRNEGSDE